jgi:DNA-binding transcriptional regulator YiaG
MKYKYKSDAMEALYEAAVGMYKIGAISNEEMAEYDKDCLVQERPKRTAVSAQPRPLVPAYADSGK